MGGEGENEEERGGRKDRARGLVSRLRSKKEEPASSVLAVPDGEGEEALVFRVLREEKRKRRERKSGRSSR